MENIDTKDYWYFPQINFIEVFYDEEEEYRNPSAEDNCADFYSSDIFGYRKGE